MKRWLSVIKRHVTPGTWARPAKKRRPITVMPGHGLANVAFRPPTPAASPARSVSTYSSVPSSCAPPLARLEAEPQASIIPPCDTYLILDRYYRRPEIMRRSSQALPLEDLPISRQAYRDYAFIDFGPTYSVTVSELLPHQLILRKPRQPRLSVRITSYFRESVCG